jgi:hypothetical protein
LALFHPTPHFVNWHPAAPPTVAGGPESAFMQVRDSILKVHEKRSFSYPLNTPHPRLVRRSQRRLKMAHSWQVKMVPLDLPWTSTTRGSII